MKLDYEEEGYQAPFLRSLMILGFRLPGSKVVKAQWNLNHASPKGCPPGALEGESIAIGQNS
jgi:hypothetical protein